MIEIMMEMKKKFLFAAVLACAFAPGVFAAEKVSGAAERGAGAVEVKNASFRPNGAKRIDISGDDSRKVIVARGSEKEYHAHPTTVLMPDGKTIFCAWNLGHGGRATPVAKSADGGLTWTRMDSAMPPNYANFVNCPSIYRIVDPQGVERLWIFASRTITKYHHLKPIEIPNRFEGYMPRVVSEDGGKTWRELPPLGPFANKGDNPFRNVMTFSSMVRLKDGSTLGLFHRGAKGKDRDLQVMQSVTKDGGFTWSEPRVVCDGADIGGLFPCEPFVFRSPDGNELCCIMRENKLRNNSLVMFSRDEGKTWTRPVSLPVELSGDRHQGIYLPDGRLVIVFRSRMGTSPSVPLRFVAWVGTYDDIKNGRSGQYDIFLCDSTKDGFYPGIHLLDDGTIVATTYATLKGDKGCSIVSVRFKMSEIDALAGALAE